MKNDTTAKVNKIQLKNGSAIVVSTMLGTGISAFVGSLDESIKHCLVTPDLLARKALGFPEIKKPDDKPLRLDGTVTKMLFNSFVSARMEQGIPSVIIDPYCINEASRAEYAGIAKAMGSAITFISLSPDTATPESLHEDARFFGLMDNEARAINADYTPLPYQANHVTNFSGRLELFNNNIEVQQLDVIGDIHGMYHELENLLKKMGYEVFNNKISHPEGRKIVFLGDYVDRGYDSINTLKLVKNAVESGHYAIRGNHEEMLLQSFNSDTVPGRVNVKSIAAAGTLDKLLRLPKDEQVELVEFIKRLPAYLTHQEYALVHADVETFSPNTTPKSQLVYGDTRLGEKPADLTYSKNFFAGVNKYKLIRGHSKSFSTDGVVISLDGGQAFGGDLIGLRLDDFIRDIERKKPFSEALKVNTFTQKCEYNFNNVLSHRADNLKKIRDLTDKKLIKLTSSLDKRFALFNFTDDVYRRRTWNADSFLENCRGMVVSIDGHVVIAGQDVYQEIGMTADVLPKDERVYYGETIPGFNVNVGSNPYESGVIISSAESFLSSYTDMAKQVLDKAEGLQRIDQILSSEKITLNLTVQHHNDPRGVNKNDPSQDRVYLISGKNNETLMPLSEQQLNEIAVKARLLRPQMTLGKFASVRDILFNSPTYSVTIRVAGDAHSIYYKMPTLSGISRKMERVVRGKAHWDDVLNSPDFLFENKILIAALTSISKEMSLVDFRFERESEELKNKIGMITKHAYLSMFMESDKIATKVYPSMEM